MSPTPPRCSSRTPSASAFRNFTSSAAEWAVVEGQSYCILMSKRKIASDTRKRLELMPSTTDGFAIAEADMQMRGPGDIEGTMQSGMPIDLHIANLATDGQIVQLAGDYGLRRFLTQTPNSATRKTAPYCRTGQSYNPRPRLVENFLNTAVPN